MPVSESVHQSHTRVVEIANEFGLHIRPASVFVKVASEYDSDLIVEKDGNEVAGKSIFGLMSLEAARGSKLHLTARGNDAVDMLERLVSLVECQFQEEA
ncbi:MAG: HPr family phosphocarrier protein [Nitrospinaceae bacterium]|nr:HPr family phosphocarrier protein [Nitrospinaceae bacterium]